MSKISRRRFTLGLGASLLAAPFVEFLTAPAYAKPGKAAKRLLVFFTPNGTVHHHWRPKGKDRQFSLPTGSILEPLVPYQKDIVVLDGLSFKGATNHEGGMAAMLTGKGGASHESGGKSVDQYIAGKLGGKSRFPSLEFGVQTSPWGGNVQTRMSYKGPGQRIPPNDNPTNVYKRLWGDVAGKPDKAEQILRERKSVLDIARDDLKQLHRLLGQEERYKLDQHLHALREAEKGLQAPRGGAGCRKPQPAAVRNHLDNNLFPEVGKIQTDMMIAALACGMTKVASIQWSHTVGPTVFSWLGIQQGHHALSHMSNANPKGVANFVKAERWFAEQFAYTLKKLKEMPDPSGGGSMLDTSLVLWAKEMGDGRLHTCIDVPFVLAGRGGGLDTGRYLRYKQGTSHQQLLVSICHQMGLDNATFGDPSLSTGPLSGL